MKFLSKSTIAALLPLASLTFTAPTPGALPSGFKIRSITRDEILARLNISPANSNDALTKRTPGNVYFCTGSDWSNTCQVLEFPLEEENPDSCWAIPSPFFESVGSIGPDAGALCFLSTNDLCQTQDDLQISYPGISNLYDVDGTDWGHSAQAMLCTQCSACT